MATKHRFLGIEKGPGFKSGIKDIWKYFTIAALGNAIIAWFFWGSKTLVMIDVGTEAGLSMPEIASWIFVLHLFNGILALIMCLYYKQPFVIAGMIPLYSILLSTMKTSTYAEVLGAFFVAGVILVILGATGAIKKILGLLPMPLVMGMVGGALFSLTTPIFTTAASFPLAWAVAMVAFIGFMLVPKLASNFPAALVGLFAGLFALTLTGQTTWSQMSVPAPVVLLQTPAFSWRAILGMTVPVLALFIGNNTTQAVGSLRLNGYDPPVNALTVIPGLAAIAGSFLCSFPCSPAGPTTALLSGPASGKDPNARYVAAFITSILQILFAVLIMSLISLTQCVPAAFISFAAALAMIDVTMAALRTAFSGGFELSAMFAFVITMSGISLFGIGSAFWGLMGGIVIALTIERKQYFAFIKEANAQMRRDKEAKMLEATV